MTDREKIIDLRMKGVSRGEICTQLDLTLRQVNDAIESVMVELRDAAPLIVEEMFHVHNERLERLFQIVQKRIDAMVDFDADLLRVCLSILERQSKLLGLDKANNGGATKTRKGRPAHVDWLDDATPSELLHEAERYNLSLPEKFKLVGE